MLVDVPNGPGVSPIFSVANLTQSLALVSNDLVSFNAYNQAPWGVYEDGAPVVTADTTLAVIYKQEFAVADYPIEEGGFESYDKVQIPYDVRIRLLAGGSDAAISALEQSAQAVAGSINDDYQVVTPTRVYSNATCSHQDSQRVEKQGTNMVMIEMWFLEIRTTAQQSGGSASTASPDSTPSVDAGDVQSNPITASNAQAAGLNIDNSGNVSFPNSVGSPTGGSFQLPGVSPPAFGQQSPYQQ